MRQIDSIVFSSQLVFTLKTVVQKKKMVRLSAEQWLFHYLMG